MHEFGRAWMAPMTYWAEAGARMFSAQGSWLSGLPGATRMGRWLRAGLPHRQGLRETPSSASTPSTSMALPARWSSARCCANRSAGCCASALYRSTPATWKDLKDDPPVLVVAPLSGHHSTLLRDTVRTLLRDHKVYITDWIDARMVPTSEGEFSLEDYVAYVQEFIRLIGAESLHVISVCQRPCRCCAAVSLMASNGEVTPRSLVMMGGPIDTRENPPRSTTWPRTSRCGGSRAI
jgi:poly(3-hydroxybutyrate) depolymerase